jgi:hypothetical protein
VVLKRLRTSEGLSLEWAARRFEEGELCCIDPRVRSLVLDLPGHTRRRRLPDCGFRRPLSIPTLSYRVFFAELVGEIDTLQSTGETVSVDSPSLNMIK